MLADFVVLDQNLLKDSTCFYPNTQVLLTVVDGQEVYQRSVAEKGGGPAAVPFPSG